MVMVPAPLLLNVDDNEIFRRGLRGLINTQHDMELVGETSSEIPAVAEIERSRPDVLIADIRIARDLDLCGGGRGPGKLARFQDVAVHDARVGRIRRKECAQRFP